MVSMKAWRVFGILASGLLCLLPPAGLALAQPMPQTAREASAVVIEDSLNIWEKRLVQEGLILLGYYNGFADGVFGQRSRDAVAAFQTKHGRAGTGNVTAADALTLGSTALALRNKLGWRPLDTATGMVMSYPAALLSKREGNRMGGETLSSPNGSISLLTIHIADASPDAINRLFDKQTNDPDDHVTYQFRRSNLFILSGDQKDGKFYRRLEQRGSDLRGYDLVWNNSDDAVMQGVSVLISNGFFPFGDDNAGQQPSYPTLSALAQQSGSGTGEQGAGTPPAGNQTAQGGDSSSDQGEGVIEQKAGALPPPKDGSLVTSDGKGLRFTYQYLPPKSDDLGYAYKWATDTHLFSNIPEIDGLDGLMMIPRPLRYVTAQCGTVNAFYSKRISAVVMCYEMIDSLTKMGAALAKGARDPQALTIEFVRDNLRFILLHESGHALIDLLDLPAVGREEDSVDQMAAVLLMAHAETSESQNDIARVIQLAATWFKVNSTQNQSNDMAVYSDEHGLDAQRYFNLLCFVYGRNPDSFHAIVDRGMLPKARADRCPDEAAKITRSWSRLLLPHFSPRFQPHDDGAPGARGTPASAPAAQPPARNPLEWDGKSNPFE